MHDLSIHAVTDAQTNDIIDVYVSCAPMESDRMFGYYLSEWEEGVRADLAPLPEPVRASIETALENNDFETLSTMGFEDPLFFYNVLATLRLTTFERPGKGGFSCMR